MHTAAADSASSPSSVISAVAVSKSWGSHQVFSNLTAEVPRGVTGLLGSNGSGKTTLLGMLLGLHDPDGGSLRILGEDPTTAGPDLRQHIGYSPEHHDLPNDMAAQDLVRHIAQLHGLPRREATTRSSDALWLVALGEERARPIGTMSTGQRQRVKLAQAIAHGPSIILLDEPTDNLDVASAEALEAGLATFDGTVVVVSPGPLVPGPSMSGSDPGVASVLVGASAVVVVRWGVVAVLASY